MKRAEIKKIIENLSSDIESIQDEKVKLIQTTLLNLVEFLLAENERLSEENQQLKDEINRLKGEQGKPSIRKQSENKDISSEKERNNRNTSHKKKKKKQSKKNKIIINRKVICEIDKQELPLDAEFKGYHSVTVQDIIIQADNIEFKREMYYSKSLNKTFIAPLPTGYQGEFGPHIKALILDLYHCAGMTEPALNQFFKTHGILIGTSTISRFITDKHDVFHQEKNEIVNAGLLSTNYQQMDDTSARVNGNNYYNHILCNEYFTAYFTRKNKDRLTIIDILSQGNTQFLFNEFAFSMMEKMNLSKKNVAILRENHNNHSLNHEEIDNLLNTLFTNPKKNQTSRQIILESTAIAAYRTLPYATHILLTDDAPQYNLITEYHPLCWIHDGRHYKKLKPVVPLYRRELDAFLDRYWDYYAALLDYKISPTPEKDTQLSMEFDALFSTKTGYQQLNERIEKTKAKKESLLLVMQFPNIPLHNNGSELGARDQARRRDINLQTINEKGTEGKDTFMTIKQTAKKLAVNTYHYFLDRVSGAYKMPSLANLISELA
jgi:hypothetical protein